MYKYLLGNREGLIKSVIFFGIGCFGFVSLIDAIYEILNGDLNESVLIDSLIVLIFLLLIFSKSVTLPSGSVWRPSIGLILFSSFVFPLHYSSLVTFLGIFISSLRSRKNVRNTFISFGHLALGIYSVKIVSHSLYNTFGFMFPQAFCWLILGLVTHFVVNRFISALLVSYRKGKPLLNQVILIKNDLNWGYVSTYLISMSMVLLYHAYGVWGILGPIILLYSIYFSVFNFKKVNELEVISLKDALTGAENRKAWEDFKQKFFLKGLPGTLTLIDLDNFKGINDRWGHDVGDLILCETVNCLMKGKFKGQRIFRFGGDEFILFIPHNHQELMVIQQMIKKRIQDQNNEWRERKYFVSMSAGMKFISSAEESLDDIFIEIDQQMYKNKAKRKTQLEG